ncbi:MAG: GyrI-like domain-containing protein, partial [Oscillospiraceae bacterium]|nr:GyrI-like domain-containing protein [Oscillospiraceae bacterium]
MFEQKDDLTVVSIADDILVVGLSLAASGLPERADAIGELWGAFEGVRRASVTGALTPTVNYGFWYSKPDGGHDYMVGSAVAEPPAVPEGMVCARIPAGRFIKATFNARDFTELVCGDLLPGSFAKAKAYAAANGL